MRRRFGGMLLVIALLLQPICIEAVDVSAASAILMDAGSGRILYEKDAHQPRMIASITKLMTALVALESGHDSGEMVTIKQEWVGAEGSSLYLRTGEQYQLGTLLYGLLLHSGNDAALAVAGYCGGSVEQFIQQMNEKAAQLGMKNSHFTNPSGLTQDGHYSSAYDMALLAQACLKNDVLSQIVATKSVTLEGKSFTNHNKLLWQYEGCIGMKTGYTEKAGRTLVSAARRDGLTLICVTLNAPNDWKDHKALFDYGFSSYRAVSPYKNGETVGSLPVEGSLCPVCPIQVEAGPVIALAQGEEIQTQLKLSVTGLRSPVVCGESVGEVVYCLNGQELCRSRLMTAAAVSFDAVTERTALERLKERYEQLIS